MTRKLLLLVLGLGCTASLLWPLLAANNPYGIVKGVNGQWPVIQCGSGTTPQSCTEHWVLGSGSQDPPNGFGSDGDLFWRTDLLAFRTRASGVWGPLSLGAASFPLLAPDTCVAPSFASSVEPTLGWCFTHGVSPGVIQSSGSIQVATGSRFYIGTDGTSGNAAIYRSATQGIYFGGSGSTASLGIIGGTVFAVLNGNTNAFEVTTSGVTASYTAKSVAWQPTLFTNLGTPSNGTFLYCSDCTATATCAGSGTGALAKRLNSVWVCN